MISGFKFISKSAIITSKIGETLAKEIRKLKQEPRFSLIIALEGDLGSGKTTFTKGFAKGFSIKEQIKSPTFILMHSHQLKKQASSRFKKIYHIDAYRLQNSKSLLSIGLDQILNDPENVILIEWADKIKRLLPKKYIKVVFKHLNRNWRELTVRY